MAQAHTIRSLGRDEVLAYVKEHGLKTLLHIANHDWSKALQTLSAVYTDSQQRKSNEQQRMAIEAALNAFLDRIEKKEIRVVQDAFNSATQFTAAFQAIAGLAFLATTINIDATLKGVDWRLKKVHDEMKLSNLMKIQGWSSGGFGEHIHTFVQHEMSTYHNSDKQHFFYVWNRDDDWYGPFEEKLRQEPLGTNFGGYHQDLATLCLWMRTNREVLKQTTSYGFEAVFHLLVPAYEETKIDHAVEFHSDLCPLILTSQTHRGKRLVRFNICAATPGLTLRSVDIHQDLSSDVLKWSERALFGGMLGFFSVAGLSLICPPLAGAAAAPYVVGTFSVSATGFLAGTAAMDHKRKTKRQRILLGDSIFTI
jgi:hypothetical protein